MTEYYMERMTWKEVEAVIAEGVDAILLPIGTTEQHGPHMPLDTDCVIALTASDFAPSMQAQFCDAAAQSHFPDRMRKQQDLTR
jgi:creatinine amidohydrolase